MKGPSKEDVYSAYHKGTNSSKKKKQKKLKRVQVRGWPPLQAGQQLLGGQVCLRTRLAHSASQASPRVCLAPCAHSPLPRLRGRLRSSAQSAGRRARGTRALQRCNCCTTPRCAPSSCAHARLRPPACRPAISSPLAAGPAPLAYGRGCYRARWRHCLLPLHLGCRREQPGACAPPSLPQGWAEKLFRRLQGGRERFEARIALVNVVSRTVGVHKLLLLNFYPFLQASMCMCVWLIWRRRRGVGVGWGGGLLHGARAGRLHPAGSPL